MGLNYSEFPNNSMRKVGETGMSDREMVIGHLNDCMEASRRDNMWVFVRKDVVEVAIALLKEQDAVEPYIAGSGESFETAETWWYECGHCNKPIDPNDKFCQHCGRAVKLNET